MKPSFWHWTRLVLLGVVLGCAGAARAAEAFDLGALRARAELGEADAQFGLGMVFARGLEGVTRDPVQAANWYLKAAEQGHVSAQNNLGTLYVTGAGVEKNYAEAVKWYRAAAEAGNDGAQSNLGWMFFNGWGVPNDYNQAKYWFDKAIEQGNSSAENNLGLMFQHGAGVPRNFSRAIELYRSASNKGNASAQSNLGAMYLRGEGVQQDSIEAYKWFSLAAAQGDPKAANFLENLSRTLIQGDIAEGQRRAADFRAQPEGSSRHVPEGAPRTGPSFGSGFFITEDGYLLTNFHVIQGARQVVIKRGSQNLPAEVVRLDRFNDLALLKIAGNFTAMPLIPSREVSLGESIFTIGFPNPQVQGVLPKLTSGEVNSLSGEQDDPRHFQVSAENQPGNSGGPLVDRSGRVIGVMTGRLRDRETLAATGFLPQNVNYAIKSSYVLAFLESAPAVLPKLVREEASGGNDFKAVVARTQEAVALVVAY